MTPVCCPSLSASTTAQLVIAATFTGSAGPGPVTSPLLGLGGDVSYIAR